MPPTRRTRVLAAASLLAALAFALPAQARLLFTQDVGKEPLWQYDPANGTYTFATFEEEVDGMTADDAGGVVYFMGPSTRLKSWDYNAATVTEIGTFMNAGGDLLSFGDLAWDSSTNTLYASRWLGTDAGPNGIYEINTATAEPTLVLNFSGLGTYEFRGLAFNPANGLLYGFQTRTEGSIAAGIYTIDLTTNDITFLTGYPPNPENTDLGGIVIGDGTLYIIGERAVQASGRIYTYDLATDQWTGEIQAPWFFSEITSAGAWTPSLQLNGTQVRGNTNDGIRRADARRAAPILRPQPNVIDRVRQWANREEDDHA